MSKPAVYIPASLPARLEGWTGRTKCHMSCSDGRGRYGVTVTTVIDAQGRETPIELTRSSRPTSSTATGYTVPWSEESFSSWADLVAAWPRLFLAAAKWRPRS